MTDDDAREREAWEQLERELLAQRGDPRQSELHSFGSSDDDPDANYPLAKTYMRQNELRIRSIICEGRNVKIELVTASGSISALTDALIAGGIPFASVANLLCIMGLTKFCQNGPDKPMPPGAIAATNIVRTSS